MNIRKDIILEALEKMEQNISIIDIEQLKMLYVEVENNLEKLTKTFEDLVNYHNKMIIEKIRFISKDLPQINDQIDFETRRLKENLEQEEILTKKISKSDSFEDLEKLIMQLNEKHRQKGEYENIISQIDEVNTKIEELNSALSEIDNMLYSDEFEEKLKIQLNKFNKYFSAISNELYGEKYALKFEKEFNERTKKPVYKFSAFNLNMSSGKKQGEILCFDLAYILFAEKEDISTLHFLLNDKKELMHDNQLSKVAEFVKSKGIQLVISMLKDKLPRGIIKNSNVVVELSQESKLFKI